MSARQPFIVGVGGSPRVQSSSQQALTYCLREAEDAGAVTECYSGAALALPMFDPASRQRTDDGERYLDAVRRADGLIIASPGYHGSISGLVKNALDYTEDLRDDRRPYFEGRAVACIACAAGWQGAMTTLTAMRDVVHALRGWPTPLGVAINSQVTTFGSDGVCSDEAISNQLRGAVQQVLAFTSAMSNSAAPVMSDVVAS